MEMCSLCLFEPTSTWQHALKTKIHARTYEESMEHKKQGNGKQGKGKQGNGRKER